VTSLLAVRSARLPSPIAIVGAGYLGAAVAAALPAPVIATARSGRWRDAAPPPGVTVHALDVTAEPLDVSALLAARAAVICYAPGGTQDRHALYVAGTERLLRAWTPAALERLVLVGSTSALPDRDAWLDETCDAWPDDVRGRVQRQAEQVFIEHATRGGIPWIVLRLGGLYGPERELERIYGSQGSARRRGGEPLPGDGLAPTNLVHRDDAVTAVLAALAAPAAIQGVVHVVDDDHTPRRLMVARAAAARGASPVTWAEPLPLRAVPRGKRVSNARLKTWLGVRLQHPLHRLGEGLPAEPRSSCASGGDG
jgi:nucleoside-diphosphate-sugar epimerase